MIGAHNSGMETSEIVSSDCRKVELTLPAHRIRWEVCPTLPGGNEITPTKGKGYETGRD